MSLRSAARRLAPAAVPFVLAVVLFAPATLGGKVLSAADMPLYQPPFLDQPAGTKPQNPLQADAAYVFEPDGLQVREALRDGRLPVWTPDLAAGRPLLASQQSAPLYPLNWLGVVFPYYDALAWIAVLKLVVAGAGLFLLARTLALSRGAALIGGVAFAFGTYMIVWLDHPHVNAYVLLPWLLWLAERLWRNARVEDAAGLGLVLGVAWLAGQPESALLVSLPTAAWILYRWGAERPPRAAALRRLGLAAAAGILGVALGAVMLLPLHEALQQAQNASRSQPPQPLSALTAIAFPDWWNFPGQWGAAGNGPTNFVERTLYVGALPLLLAVGGIVARRPRGPQLFFIGLTAVAAICAFDTGPVYRAIAGLPVFDQIDIVRALILASFGLAMLAAYGADALMAARGAAWRRFAVAAVAVAVIPVLAAAVVHHEWLHELSAGAKRLLGLSAPLTVADQEAESVLRWIVFAGLALGLGLVASRWRRPVVALTAAAIVLAAVDLLAMGWGFTPAITKAQAEPAPTPPIQAMRRLTASGGRVVGIDGLEPNTASRWGLRDAREHEVPAVHRVEALWRLLGGSYTGTVVAVSPQDRRTPKLLDVFGVRAVLLNPLAQRGGKPALPPPLNRAPVPYAGHQGLVVENPGAFPEAFVAYRWRPSVSERTSAYGMVLSSPRQLRDQPVVEGAPGPAAGPSRKATAARIVGRTDTSVTIDATARAPGRLVLLDTYYPGWRAEVDGKAVPIAATNVAFRSVPIPAGRHRVTFTYHPASVRTGAIVSLVALVVLLAGLVAGLILSRRRSRPSAPAPSRP
jgi:hypothetical protein